MTFHEVTNRACMFSAKQHKLYARKRDPVTTVQVVAWVPQPFWTFTKNFAHTGL
jgi:pyrroloquinoline quinone (PQQ) biosynthesis protein C